MEPLNDLTSDRRIMQQEEHETPQLQQQQDQQQHQQHHLLHSMDPQQQQQSTFALSSVYETSMNTVPIQSHIPIQSHHYPSQQLPIQQYQQPHQQYQPAQQYQPSVYTTQHQMNAYNTKAPSAVEFNAVSVSIEERATRLLAACESCLVVTRIPGVDMSFRRIMDRKCPRCSGTLVLPQEVMEMLILYGSFVPESVAVTLILGMMVLHPTLRPDFMAAAMNELLSPLQTDFVYDVAVPKRPEGLGMSLRMNQGNLVVGGFIDFENNSESPSVAARIIAVDDVLVAINKKYITSWSFEKSISMLAHAASPVYMTFRRRHAVMLL